MLLAAEHFREQLLSYAQAILGDRALAEDTVQDTFCLVATKWQTLRNDAALFPWLRTIVKFKCFETIRRQKRETVQDPAEIQKALECRLSAILEDTEFLEIRAARLRAVNKCLGLLDGRARDIMRRFYQKGDTNATIATALSLDPGYIRVYLTRIRKKVRNCVNRELSKSP